MRLLPMGYMYRQAQHVRQTIRGLAEHLRL